MLAITDSIGSPFFFSMIYTARNSFLSGILHRTACCGKLHAQQIAPLLINCFTFLPKQTGRQTLTMLMKTSELNPEAQRFRISHQSIYAWLREQHAAVRTFS